MELMDTDIHISPMFDVKLTAHGGRACFAKKNMESGTILLQLEGCLASSIFYEFRKSVCSNCYKYAFPASHKVRLEPDMLISMYPQCDYAWMLKNKKKFTGADLRFCCTKCRDSYLSREHIHELIEVYEILSQSFQTILKNKSKRQHNSADIDWNNVEITKKTIDSNWEKVQNDWQQNIDCMKPTKWLNKIPHIDEDEYACARFVAEALFNLKNKDPRSTTMKTFTTLQSNEFSKISKFPALLHFQTNVYQYLYILLPEPLKQELTVEKFRHILGSEYGNSFGISDNYCEDPDCRDCLGYRVFPEASYFNHSCAPNIHKTAINDVVNSKNVMTFVLSRNVAFGEQLCIDYKDILHFDVMNRRKVLKENWFFECACDRCISELQSIH